MDNTLPERLTSKNHESIVNSTELSLLIIMPYFHARKFTLSAESEDSDATCESLLGNLKFPAELILEADLMPQEAFGSSDISFPRVTSVVGTEVEIKMDFSKGTMLVKSDVFLPPVNMNFHWENPDDRKFDAFMDINSNKLKYRIMLKCFDELIGQIHLISMNIPVSLSVNMGIFISATNICGEFPGQFKFKALYFAGNYHPRYVAIDWAFREKAIFQAIAHQQSHLSSYPRLLLASQYFQEALLFMNPHALLEPPEIFFSEILINLSKCLELLLAGGKNGLQTNDKIREKCVKLGYTNTQYESQIIPILILRSEFDGAHPASSTIVYEDIETVRSFVVRSIDNVQNVLNRVSNYINTDHNFLEPLSQISSREHQKLMVRLKEHLQHDKL